MDNNDYTRWIEFSKSSKEYISGVKAFLENAFPAYVNGEEMKCPCKVCVNRNWHLQDVIYDHLICSGPSPLHVKWICEVSRTTVEISNDSMNCEAGIGFEDNLGEMFECTGKRFRDLENDNEDLTNADARNFYRHVSEGKQPLHPGCTKYSRLSFMIKLYHLKCLHGISESAFGDLLGLIKDAFPDAHLPTSFNAAKNIIRDLGLNYQKIHACPNSCMLYWAENKDREECVTCGVSRWVLQEKKGGAATDDPPRVIHKVAAKVMRYFPLIPRLQRLFMCKEYAKLMTWHAVGRQKDGKQRHPADGTAWKTMDAEYPDFSSENRNVSLGVAADGFNPYRSMNLSHSTWPIVLVNYNLPPWLCMKQENLILSTLVSGPDSPSNSIDVFMQPLIQELKELWEVGVGTYDASADQNFTLRARILWTISDFPGYAMLSGWSTKGRLGCPVCHYETSSSYLKHSRKMCYMNHRKFLDPTHKWRLDKRRFNGQIETARSPEILTGKDIEELLSGYINQFGLLNKRKAKTGTPFKKKSIFFDLPYWSQNPLRHNLDAMHIEKNVCDNILGTLLNMGGKSKDHLNARKDLQESGIRKPLHPVRSEDGKHLEIRAAIFDLTNKEKDIFCSVLKNAKLPYGCASNISRYVHTKERKVLGYKSHDAHFILHYMLQFAVKKTLKAEVAVPLIRLSAFLRGLWSKVIDLEDLTKLQQEIVEVLCHFEMIFPQAFFDIMVHLLVHLVREVELGGPEHLRNMFPVERYLGKLKSYVRNRSRPEGSIAEGYLAEECVTFCSRFLGGDKATTNSVHSTDFQGYPTPVEYHIGTRRNKDGIIFNLKAADWKASHRYILFNSDNKEVLRLIEEHQALLETHANSKRYKRARMHTDEFWKWLQEEVGKMDEVSRELEVLALGPNRTARRFTGYVVNGYRFHSTSRDSRCTTQNSGVFLTAKTTSFASSRDQNPKIGDVNYYGSIEDIIELDYWGEFTVVLFKCCWYQEEKDPHGHTRVNFKKLRHISDPYVLASQVQQVFYVEDPIEKMVHYVIKKLPREWCDNANLNTLEEDVNSPHLNDVGFVRVLETEVGESTWCRDDIPATRVPNYDN